MAYEPANPLLKNRFRASVKGRSGSPGRPGASRLSASCRPGRLTDTGRSSTGSRTCEAMTTRSSVPVTPTKSHLGEWLKAPGCNPPVEKLAILPTE